MRTRIETSRLNPRPFELSDVEVPFEWLHDPIVMRFPPTGPDKSPQQTTARVAGFIEHQKTHGFSKWLNLDRDSTVAIGDSGLLVLPDYGWVDLGFRLAQSYWGKGLATELASAWVRAAFDKFHLTQLGAFVHPRTLLRSGFLKR